MLFETVPATLRDRPMRSAARLGGGVAGGVAVHTRRRDRRAHRSALVGLWARPWPSPSSLGTPTMFTCRCSWRETPFSSTLANEFTEAVTPLYTSSLLALGLVLFVLTLIVLIAARLMLMRCERARGENLNLYTRRRVVNWVGLTLSILATLLGCSGSSGCCGHCWQRPAMDPPAAVSRIHAAPRRNGGLANAIRGQCNPHHRRRSMGAPAVSPRNLSAEFGRTSRLGSIVRSSTTSCSAPRRSSSVFVCLIVLRVGISPAGRARWPSR